MRSAIQAVIEFNAGRDPRRLAIKFKKMASSAFAFFRGACHRFYERLPVKGLMKDAPPAWICGDLHFENFGSFKGDNRLVYFDLNDFDEACLAPVTWDLVRFQTSLLLGAEELGIRPARARSLAKSWLEQYAQALKAGKPLWIERATACGEVESLLRSLRKRKQGDLLDDRAPRSRKQRRLRLCGKKMDDIKALPLVGARAPVVAAIERFGRERGLGKAFRVLDVADRVAGTGSLGLDRVVIVVQGDGGKKDKNWLFDAKSPPRSAPAGMSPCTQPRWPSEAERVVTLQRRLQAVSPALLAPLSISGRPFVLRELMPSEDRVELKKADDRGLEIALEDMGQVVAWAHLRGAGRQGAASVEDLVAFATDSHWRVDVLAIAREAARKAEIDHAQFGKPTRRARSRGARAALRNQCS